MIFRGFQTLSMVDYPGHICATVFTAGCNMRCPYCHNPDLVLNKDHLPTFSEEEIFEFLDSRKGKLDGVCITGGEPTIHKGLKAFIKKVKERGFKVKLDSNGSNPAFLESVIDEGLVDFIAMDVKELPENYPEKLSATYKPEDIEKSIVLLKENRVPYEFRLTAVPEVTDADAIRAIAKQVKGAEKFCLQQFIPANNMFDTSISKTFSHEELTSLGESIKDHVKHVEIRA